MDAEKIAIAEACLHAAHDGSLDFPRILGRLMAAGFEGYAVDYRLGVQVYYLNSGEALSLAAPATRGEVAPAFDAAAVAELIRWAQANRPDYSYAAFCTRVKAAGCAGYFVSLPGRRVVYFGRTAETHVEHFPG
ncbi:DUF1398 domain-containing protein [Rhodobacter sp. SGA-6-6]|uniref:DUF1398 domain-containing protein n=1 Tax=Rhodobacter sp. SGA-6-6 TaxID=2710882 RepID=UPI0013ECE086|nr:DUF1398 domain-containing protein [Rhodobacter sp. SGA-6-6]NGM44158.1 DUF1398 domain-containing protein [Rhodobacter sp. SGA-6-6]